VVYLRYKQVKGEKYFYLVKSVWDSKRNTSRQETIKYLGKSSEFTRDDIPSDYRNDPKIISFLASDSMASVVQKEKDLSKLRDQLYVCLTRGDFDGAKKICDNYSQNSGFVIFFEKLLTPVMYHVGDMWQKNKISIADEHVASNIASMLVKIIYERNFMSSTKKKVIICVPEGEQHNLGANILEAYLASVGFKVYNLSPSEPHDSITYFIGNINPHVVIISVTLSDNIKPAQRLVKKILQKTKVSVLVGGQAVIENTEFVGAQVVKSDLKNLPRLINNIK
jgi:methanogenic corrinoid protein MtbC1